MAQKFSEIRNFRVHGVIAVRSLNSIFKLPGVIAVKMLVLKSPEMSMLQSAPEIRQNLASENIRSEKIPNIFFLELKEYKLYYII